MIKNLAAPALLLLLSVPVIAQTGKEGAYLGISFGGHTVNIDNIQGINIDADENAYYSVRGGLEFETNFAIEFEFSSSSGELTATNGLSTAAMDYDIGTIAAYAVYRTPGPLFFKVRGGILREKIETGGFDETDTGISTGIGAGFRLDEVLLIELEATMIEEDVFYYGLSTSIKF